MMRSARRAATSLSLLALLITSWVAASTPADDAVGEPAVATLGVLEAKILDALATGADAGALIEKLEAGRPARARRSVSTAATGLDDSLADFRAAATRAVDKAADQPSVLDLSRLRRAHEDLLAADMLVRSRFSRVAARLEEAGAGEVPERLVAAEAAYRELVDPILQAVDGPLAALRRSSKQGEKTEHDREALEREVLAALAAVLPRLEGKAADVSPAILRSRLLPFRRGGLAPRPLVLEPAIVPAYLDATDPAPEPADHAGTADAPLASYATTSGSKQLISSKFVEHYAVRKGDMIYDRITGPDGLHVDEYRELFEYGDKGLLFDKVVKLGD